MNPVRPPNPLGKRLESWKEIAAHLNRGVRTVIRWEKTEGLPIHRHLHEKKPSVFAYTAEIDTWLKTRHPEMGADTAHELTGATRRRGWVAVAALILTAAGIGFWAKTPPPSLRFPLRAEPLTSYPNGQWAPTFAPDARQFVFVWTGNDGRNVDLYLQTSGSGNPRRLTDHPDLDFSPAWSPDGKWVAFLRRDPEMKTSLLLMSAPGGGERKLADLRVRHYMDATQIAWAPDSRHLLVADRGDEGPGLFLLSVADLQRRRLVKSATDRGDLDPAISPDGRHMAFRCDNTDVRSEICLLSLTPTLDPIGEPERLTHLGVLSTSPVWTQDRDHLVFSSGGPGTGPSLYRVTVFPATRRSSAIEQLTEPDDPQFSLASSPEHGLVAYTTARSRINLWSVERNGRSWNPPARLAGLASNREDSAPPFSPDGSHIAFASTRAGAEQIWVARRDGSGLHSLDTGPDPATFPEWSSDGTQIAFVSQGRDAPAVGVIPAGGGSARFLARPGFQPRWSRDGKTLYFTRGQHRYTSVFRVAAEGGSSSEVIHTNSWNAAESTDGQSLFYAGPGGIWRRPVSGGAAELVYAAKTGTDRIAYVPRAEGLFIRLAEGGSNVVMLMKLPDRSTEVIVRENGFGRPGLAVAPDGRTLLYSRLDQPVMNLMLLRGL